jgi:hypothetical protein
MNRFQVIGVNDDRDFCECCGKKGLKRVVWINDTETGEIKHFGTTCATAPVKGFNVEREVKDAIDTFKRKQEAIAWAARREYKAKGGQYIAKADGYSWTAADPALLAQCRAAVSATMAFNY